MDAEALAALLRSTDWHDDRDKRRQAAFILGCYDLVPVGSVPAAPPPPPPPPEVPVEPKVAKVVKR